MSIIDLFSKKPSPSKKELQEAAKAAIETPKQLDRIEQQIKDLEAKLTLELRKGGCKAAS